MRTLSILLVTLLATTLSTRADEPPVPLPAPPQLVIREIRYEGTLRDSEARFTVTLDIESPTREPASAVLFDGNVAVRAPKLPTGVTIAREGNQYRLTTTRAGRQQITLELIAKVTRAEPWDWLSFCGPSAAIASVTAQAAGDGVELQLQSGTVLESKQDETGARVRGFLAADRRVSIRWQSRGKEAERRAVTNCDTTIGLQVTPTVLKLVSAFHYEILQGSLAQLQVELPAGQSLTRVEGAQIRDWRVAGEGETRRLTVEFIKPVEKSYDLKLFTEQTVESTPFSTALRTPQPADVGRESGTLTVSTEDTVVDFEGLTGLQQINAPAGSVAGYRFFGRPFALQLAARRIEPVIETAARIGVRVEDTRLLVTQTISLNVTKAGIYALELAPLAGFTVADVKGDAIEDWRETDGKLKITFGRRVLGSRPIEVRLEKATTTPTLSPSQEGNRTQIPSPGGVGGGLVTITPLRVVGAAKETAQIGAAAAAGLRLKTSELTGLREMPVGNLGGRTDETLAYTSEQADWKLTLTADRLSPRVLADIFNLVTIGDGLVGGSATIRYAIINQGVQEFRVTLPAHWKNIEFTGPNIRRREQQAAAGKDATQVWVIGLQDKAWGSYTLVVTYDYPFDPHQAKVPMGGAHVVDVERETGSIAITSAANLQIKESALAQAADGGALQRIDEMELATNDRALITRPVLLAYRYAGNQYELQAEIQRFKELEVLQAVADRTQLTTVLTDAGQLLTQASFMVKNNTKQFQRFELPAGADFWACYVANQSVKAERDGEAILVPLPRGENRDQAVPVEIVYAQKIGTLKSAWPRTVAMAAPRTDLQTTYAEWELFVPETHDLASFGGNMTVARGTTYGLRDAWDYFTDAYDHLYHHARGSLVILLVLIGFVVAIISAARRGWSGLFAVGTVVVLIALFSAMLLPALNQARHKARQANSSSNLRQIGLSIAMFADTHDGKMPNSLDDLLGTVTSTEKIFNDVTTDRRFVYIGSGRQWQGEDGNEVVAYSPDDLGGRNVLFSDGHVELVQSDRFVELLGQTAVLAPNQPGGAPMLAAVPAEVTAAPATTGGEGHAVQTASPAKPASGSPMVAGIRPLRIDIPRTGTRFVFTKVLNVKEEPLAVHVLATAIKVRNIVRSSLQAGLLFVGLIVLWWQLSLGQAERAVRHSLWVTTGAALAIAGVGSYLMTTRTLHIALILLPPILALAGLIWLIRRIAKRRPAEGGEPTVTTAPTTPPVIAGLMLMLLAAGSVQADTVAIRSASYTGTVGEKVAEFEGVLEVTTTEANQTLRLFGDDVALREVTGPGGWFSRPDVKLVREGGTVNVWLARAGATTLRVRFIVPVGGDVTKRTVAFGFPEALSTTLRLLINEPEAAVEFPSAISVKTATTGQQTTVDAVIGAGDRIDLSWTPRVKRAEETAATVFCQNAALVSFGGGVMQTRARLDYQVTQGELRQLRVQLPAGQRLLRVEGTLLRTWDVKDNVLLIELLRPVASSNAVVIVTTEKALGELPGTLSVEAPHALDVKRETGWLGLASADELSVGVETATNVQRVDAAEFTQAAALANQALQTAYRYLRPDFTLQVRAETVQPQIEAVVRQQATIATEQLQLVADVDYTIKKAGVFALRLLLPTGYTLEQVRGERVQQWTEKAGTVDVSLTERTLGATRLTLVLRRRLTELPPSVPVVGVHPLGVTKLTGYVLVGGDTGLVTRANEFQGLTEVPAAEVPGGAGTSGVLAYKYILAETAATAPWSLTVKTETVEPWVRAEVVNWLTLNPATPGLVTGRSLVRYEIANAPVKEFRLRVPAALKNVEINGTNIRRRDQTDDTWQVQLQNKVIGNYQLTVTWEMPVTTGTSMPPIAVVGIETLGTERETGAIAIDAQSPLQVQMHETTKDLLAMDVRELPAWAGRANPNTVLAYRYLRTGYKLALQVQRFDEAAVLQALVDSVRLRTVVAEDGQMMTELTAAVRNNGRQYLEVGLPPGAKVWSAFVSGRAVRPSVEQERVLVPLERSGPDGAPVRVQLTYIELGRFPATHGRLNLTSPRLDVPLKDARWELYLPPDYAYGGYRGTMTHELVAETPVSQSFSFSEYQQVETKNREERDSEIVTLAKKARSFVAGGKLKEAGELYSRQGSYEKSKASDAAKDELVQLEQELRQGQARNVMMNSAVKQGDAPQAAQPEPQRKINEQAAAEQWDKLQAAQELAVAQVLPLQVNLPTRGIRQAFTQVLQTEVNEPMTIQFEAESAKGVSWPARVVLGLGGFVGLWAVVALALARRRE